MNRFIIGICICFLLIIIFIGLLIFVIYKRKEDIKEIGKIIWNNLLIIWNNLLRIIVIFNVLIIILRYLNSISKSSYNTINIINISMIILFLISILLIVFSKKISENKKLMIVVIIIYFLIIFFVPMYTLDPVDTGGIEGPWYRSYKNIYGFSLYREMMGDPNFYEININ